MHLIFMCSKIVTDTIMNMYLCMYVCMYVCGSNSMHFNEIKLN